MIRSGIETQDFAKHVYSGHTRMADTWADNRTEEHEVNKRRWNLKETRSIRGYWDRRTGIEVVDVEC